MANEEARELFLKRARTIAEVRRWFDARGFVEVETPVLQPLYGGALARPFTTHHNALDRDLYLRIATELYLKRLVVGGIEKVYELGKDFRNEGISHKHNPEFTMLEWYEAYADYNDTATELEGLVSAVAQEVLGTTKIEREGETIELSPPWRRVTAAGRDQGGDRHRRDGASLSGGARQGDGSQARSRGGLGKAGRRPALQGGRAEADPAHVHRRLPGRALALRQAPPQHEGLVERWEAFVGGIEISNSFTELNDPDEQRRRFEAQAEETARGDEETQPYDETFVESLEQGMPPTGGAGLGIDRLVMILTGAKSLREVVLFPAMRN